MIHSGGTISVNGLNFQRCACNVMYLIVLLTMEEQVTYLFHPVRKCGLACYLPSVILMTLGSGLRDMGAFGWISGRNTLSNRV